MKRIFFFIVLKLLISCQGEQVELAQLSHGEIVEVKDHSPVYLFFRTVEIDTVLEVNRKNTIASTNWVFHVDKRFQMKQIVDDLTKLQNKKNSSTHKREDSNNLFSFMDKSNQGLSFFDFTPVKYSYPNYFSTQYIKENPDYHKHFVNFSIDFKSTTNITVNDFEVPINEMESFLKDMLLLTNSNKKALVYMNFNNNVSFEDYLNLWQQVKRFDNSLIEISPVHFVYDSKAIENCDCK